MKTILKLIMHILPSAKQQGTHVQPDNACNICLGISISLSLMRTSHLLIQPLYLQQHKYNDQSLELVQNNLTIRYFRFLELFLTYMRI
jgi:hypothetical protein